MKKHLHCQKFRPDKQLYVQILITVWNCVIAFSTYSTFIWKFVLLKRVHYFVYVFSWDRFIRFHMERCFLPIQLITVVSYIFCFPHKLTSTVCLKHSSASRPLFQLRSVITKKTFLFQELVPPWLRWDITP